MLFRLRVFPPFEKNGPQVIVGIGVSVVDREHLAVTADRVVQAPLLLIGEAQVAPRIDPVGADAESCCSNCSITCGALQPSMRAQPILLRVNGLSSAPSKP